MSTKKKIITLLLGVFFFFTPHTYAAIDHSSTTDISASSGAGVDITISSGDTIVIVHGIDNSTNAISAVTATLGGNAMTQLGTINNDIPNDQFFFYYLNPPTGTQSVVITETGGTAHLSRASVYSGSISSSWTPNFIQGGDDQNLSAYITIDEATSWIITAIRADGSLITQNQTVRSPDTNSIFTMDSDGEVSTGSNNITASFGSGNSEYFILELPIPTGGGGGPFTGWDYTNVTDVGNGYPSFNTQTITPSSPPTGDFISSIEMNFTTVNGATQYAKLVFFTPEEDLIDSSECFPIEMPSEEGLQTLTFPDPVLVPEEAGYFNFNSSYTDDTCTDITDDNTVAVTDPDDRYRVINYNESSSTSGWAEVTGYIPSPGVATSTGITTVGANFAIPTDAQIEYVGYKILSNQSTVLFNETATTTEAGNYTIDTDFNFTQSGLYTGHAYFAYYIGDTLWEVDNPTIQQILVNVTQWTINPDGSFTQNPATTSTTTLPNASFNCGDGFTGSICNMVALLVVPKSSSIDNVKGNFNQIMGKAPFSFFTESKNVFAAFNNKTVAESSLGFHFFGEDIDFISTTTADSIGLTEPRRESLKTLMTVGIWILLAWFLYWRIASIFGV